MKKATSVLVLTLVFAGVSFGQNEKKEKEKDYYKMFTVEAAHVYNSLISKQGVNARFNFWVNKTYNFGPEFHYYFPSAASKTGDYQLDFNFRKILVNFHPITFDVMVGPGFRNYKTELEGRKWNFDGINIGFGLALRVKNASIFVMPNINHLDPSLQISSGLKYHFTIERALRFKNRYNLKKAK
jgi:hypothetical protein